MGKKKANPALETPPAVPPPANPSAVARPDAEQGYTVVARRYRPQQFSELIGQEHVAQSLMNALNSGRVAHAYLFTGARGVGKTSSARILAKALNCVKGPTATPCDACEICLSIAKGDDVDVLEIDGASNNKVEEIRDLRSNVGFRPSRARYKIYIIDEVHMLSTGAFNALLKTLEEPPPHVKFIFATTELQKIPITILSRCQRFDFVNVGVQKIYQQLKYVVGKEGLVAEDDALHMIARRAAGSMRDSQSLLDQLLAFAEGNLTAEKVHLLLGIAGDDRILSLADSILKGDARSALELVAKEAERGLQLGELLDQLIDYWRGLMLLLTAGPEFNELSGSQAYLDRLRAHAQETSLDTVLAGLDVMTTAKMRMRGTTQTQLLLEMTAVRLARLGELIAVGELSQWLRAGGMPVASDAPSRPTTANSAKILSGPPEQSVKKKPLSEPSSTPSGAVEVDATPGPVEPSEFWESLQVAVGPLRAFELKQVLEYAISAPNTLVIRFPSGYSPAYDSCASETGRESLLQTLRRMTGRDWMLRVEQVAPSGESAPGAEQPATAYRSRKDLLQLPMFKRVVEILGGQSVHIDPAFDASPPAINGLVLQSKIADLMDEVPLPNEPDEG